jgi:hypothetical protein
MVNDELERLWGEEKVILAFTCRHWEEPRQVSDRIASVPA